MLEKRSNTISTFINFSKKINMGSKPEEKHAENLSFGVDLQDLIQRTGVQSKWSVGTIPRCLLHMFTALEKPGLIYFFNFVDFLINLFFFLSEKLEISNFVGVFRVNGKQTKIQSLREVCDQNNGEVIFLFFFFSKQINESKKKKNPD